MLAPHPVLQDYYSDEVERPAFLRRIFDATARDYDRITSLMSLGTGARYRGWALRRAGLEPGMRALDVATGTGAVAREALSIVRPTGIVVGLEPSAGMLAVARASLRIPAVRAVADRLPLRDGSFDFISMGYALRHVSDLQRMLAEYRRVLRPGGTLLILDFCRPQTAAGYRLARLYLSRIVPMMASLSGGGPEARRLMRYCWETVDRCVSAASIVQTVREGGFGRVQTARWFGIFIEYCARRT